MRGLTRRTNVQSKGIPIRSGMKLANSSKIQFVRSKGHRFQDWIEKYLCQSILSGNIRIRVIKKSL